MPIAIEAVSVQDYLQWLDSFSSNDTPIPDNCFYLEQILHSSLLSTPLERSQVKHTYDTNNPNILFSPTPLHLLVKNLERCLIECTTH